MELCLKSHDIAQFLRLPLHGKNIDILGARSLDNSAPLSLVFAKKYSDEIMNRLNEIGEILAIVVPDYSGKLTCSHIVTENPRLAFARTLHRFFVKKAEPRIAKSAILDPDVIIGKDVSIGEYAVIEDGVVIGDRTEIHHHVVIYRGVVIGDDCIIGSHCVIGAEGLNYPFDENNRPFRFPHMGGVHIGNHVNLGMSTTIARGTLDRTVIGDYVKIGNLCNVAHNVTISENAIITSGAILSGKVTIGKNAWVAPNATIRESIRVGEGAMVGIGATVVKDLGDGLLAGGNLARVLPRTP